MDKEEQDLVLLLKATGESLSGISSYGYSYERMHFLAQEIIGAYRENPHLALALMPGGGNLGRGSKISSELRLKKKNEVFAHLAAMSFTVANTALLKGFLQQEFEEVGLPVKIVTLTNFVCPSIGGKFEAIDAREMLKRGVLMIIGGGSGQPYFTTDTAGALAAAALGCSRMLKGTKVNGVFDRDPRQFPDSERIPRMTPKEFLERELDGIFDKDGVIKLEQLKLAAQIFDLFTPGNLARAIRDPQLGTIIQA